MRFDPFNNLDSLFQDLPSERWSPMPLEIHRTPEAVSVDIDIPGVDPNSIDLVVDKNVLALSAERVRKEREGELIANERFYGRLTRRVFLGDGLDRDNIEATYADGVLQIRIPLSETAKPKRITIHHPADTAALTT